MAPWLNNAGRITVYRSAALSVFVAMAVLARANAAMGLALEMFGFEYWWPYVVATVILEAWMIGRKLGDSWPRAILISLVANLLTATCAAGGCFAPFLHGTFVGTALDPNPLMNALFLFSAFGLASALAESVIWKLDRRIDRDSRIVQCSLYAHAVGVPLALCILLIPPHPYVGLVAETAYHRRLVRREALSQFLPDQLAGDRFPRYASAEAFMRAYGSSPENGAGKQPSAWTAAYEPDFGRFDTGEARRRPYEWNPRLAGLYCPGIDVAPSGPSAGVDEDLDHSIWIIRIRDRGGYSGYALDVADERLLIFDQFSADRLERAQAQAIQDSRRLEREARLQANPSRQAGG